jgi:hypothetical protein
LIVRFGNGPKRRPKQNVNAQNSGPDLVCQKGGVSRKLMSRGHLQAREMGNVQVITRP